MATADRKLSRLRNWLTLPDTVRHLSIVFGEEFTEADVYCLALEGRLRLSVYLPNKTRAIQIKAPDIAARKFGINQIEEDFDQSPLDKDEPLVPHNSKFTNISDLWDLSMIGHEWHYIKNEFQECSGGSRTKETEQYGIIVESQDGALFQLVDCIENVVSFPIPDNLLQTFKDLLGENIECSVTISPKITEKIRINQSTRYNFSFGLPEGSILAVRTSALRDLEERFDQEESDNNNLLKQHKETAYLNKKHAFHANELKIAVEAWVELYERNPPSGVPKRGHKNYILDHLEKIGIGITARERIAIVINPNPKGGASPSEPGL